MLNLSIPYSRLGGDAFWNNISLQYMNPPHRYYHNMNHVVFMYQTARNLKMDYDIDLDVAILIHDCVYDGEPYPEIRSIHHFFKMIQAITTVGTEMPEKVFMPFGVVRPNKIADLVISTIDHNPKSGNDNRLMLLDLYGFVNVKDRKQNYISLLDELVKLYPSYDKQAIKTNMMNNLKRISNNIINYINSVDEDSEYYSEWVKVYDGINEQISDIQKEIEKK